MEVLHEDFLERCIVTGNKKEYKKAYFVFRQDAVGSKTLEYFKDSNWRKSEPRGVCNLFNGYSVRVLTLNETKKKYGIELKTVGKVFELHASSETLREKWIEVLNKDLENFHNTKLLESPVGAYSFVRLLTGQLHIQITDCSVVLMSNRVPTITWRFGTIRRYKSKDGAFVLEVGRKSETGEGTFRFQVPDPNKLFDILDKALKQRIQLKRNQDSSIETSRTSSFDEITNRRSMNVRSGSMDDRPLPASPPLPPTPPEYSTLSHVPINTPDVPDVNGYDKLFAATPPKHSTPNVFENTSLIGRRLSINEDSSDENYIDMSGMKAEIINECRSKTKPQPAPRPKSNLSEISIETSRSPHIDIHRPISGPEVDLIDFNAHDSSALDVSNSPRNIANMSEYHALNRLNPPKSSTSATGYDHLNNMYQNKNHPHPTLSDVNQNIYRNSCIDEIYDSPKSHSNDKKDNSQPLKLNSDMGRKPPPPPVPSRPQPPTRRPRGGSDRMNSCDSLPDTVLVLGKSSAVHISKTSNPSEAIYDSPRVNLKNDTRKTQSLNAEAFLHMNTDLNDVYQVPRVDGF